MGTGTASREFLFVKDAAKAIVSATELYNGAEPINIGAGSEVTIRDLVEMIAELTGYSGKTVWDRTKPDGQPRRGLDIERAREELQFSASTSLREGLEQTIDWYHHHRLDFGTSRAGTDPDRVTGMQVICDMAPER